MPARFSRRERSWVLYDVANSAYSLAVTTAIFPLFFKTEIAAGVPGATSTAWLAFANSLFTLVVAVLATALGPMGDYEGRKKRFFASFFALGVAATGAIAFAVTGRPLAALALYVVSGIGFAGANVFYDAFLTDVSTPERMDRVSAAGYAWGYVGGALPFVVAMAVMMGLPRLGLTIGGSGVRIAFVIAALWWLLFTIPLLRHVRQVHFLPAAGRGVIDTFRDAIGRVANVVREIRRYRTVMLFLLAYFFYIDGVGTIIKLATAYGTDIGLSARTVLVVLLVVQVVAFPCTLLYGKLAAVTSPRAMLLAGIGVYIVVTALAFAIPRLPVPAQVPTFWAICAAGGHLPGRHPGAVPLLLRAADPGRLGRGVLRLLQHIREVRGDPGAAAGRRVRADHRRHQHRRAQPGGAVRDRRRAAAARPGGAGTRPGPLKTISGRCPTGRPSGTCSLSR